MNALFVFYPPFTPSSILGPCCLQPVAWKIVPFRRKLREIMSSSRSMECLATDVWTSSGTRVISVWMHRDGRRDAVRRCAFRTGVVFLKFYFLLGYIFRQVFSQFFRDFSRERTKFFSHLIKYTLLPPQPVSCTIPSRFSSRFLRDIPLLHVKNQKKIFAKKLSDISRFVKKIKKITKKNVCKIILEENCRNIT